MHGSCIKFENSSSLLDLLHFSRYIMRRYLIKYENQPHPGKRGRPQKNVGDVRYDRIDYWVTTQDKQSRCAHCHTKTTTRCEKRDIGLHVKSFKDYHTQ